MHEKQRPFSMQKEQFVLLLVLVVTTIVAWIHASNWGL